MRLLLRRVGGSDAYEEHEGDLSLGGVAVPARDPVHPRYEVRFRLAERELHAEAEPLGNDGAQGKLQLRFVDLDTATELAIARYFDELAMKAR
jgi:hypothetical protein